MEKGKSEPREEWRRREREGVGQKKIRRRGRDGV